MTHTSVLHRLQSVDSQVDAKSARLEEINALLGENEEIRAARGRLSAAEEQLRAAGAPAPLDAIVLYFIEMLEELAGKSALRKLLPGDMDTIMQRARGAIGKGPASVEGE